VAWTEGGTAAWDLGLAEGDVDDLLDGLQDVWPLID
jgi:hypothetical protein